MTQKINKINMNIEIKSIYQEAYCIVFLYTKALSIKGILTFFSSMNVPYIPLNIRLIEYLSFKNFRNKSYQSNFREEKVQKHRRLEGCLG